MTLNSTIQISDSYRVGRSTSPLSQDPAWADKDHLGQSSATHWPLQPQDQTETLSPSSQLAAEYRREAAYHDPWEEWAYSIVSAAALVGVLLGAIAVLDFATPHSRQAFDPGYKPVRLQAVQPGSDQVRSERK